MKAACSTLALAVGIACAGCNPKPATHPVAGPQASSGPAMRIRSSGSARHGVTIVAQERNRILYRLQAKSTESKIAAGNSSGRFAQVHVTFFGKGGTSMQGTAPNASVDEATQTITMSGGVEARTNDGIVLTCRTLRYSRATQRIVGSGNVRVTSPQGFHVDGETIESDLQLRNVRVKS